MDQVRVARQSNRVVRRWPGAQRAMGRLRAKLYRPGGGLPVIALEPAGT